MTLLSLASRQIWPQVLGFLHLNPRPDRLVLFHTNEEQESHGPAKRLKELFAHQGLLPEAAVELMLTPHDDFAAISGALTQAAQRQGLTGDNSQLHFTGGNKLMALAATHWCRLTGTPCFYLERDFRVFPFVADGRDLRPQPSFALDPHLALRLDPLALLRCQLGAAEVVGDGQRLTLNEQGQKLPLPELGPLIRQGVDFRKFLTADREEATQEAGFPLEYATAATLLRLGVPVVQRSVRLAPRSLRGPGREEGELDLVFNWGGKLWVVDCKDRHSAQTRVEKLRTEILKHLTPGPRLDSLLLKLEEELRAKDLHPLKEDLLAVAEVGGLLGRAICVRRSPLPPQAAEFARSRKLVVVTKDHLFPELRTLLQPHAPPARPEIGNPTALPQPPPSAHSSANPSPPSPPYLPTPGLLPFPLDADALKRLSRQEGSEG